MHKQESGHHVGPSTPSALHIVLNIPLPRLPSVVKHCQLTTGIRFQNTQRPKVM
uniref:Uncharacterized protein n=1 Tax=Anguilla anguilla TaxID=7936 RepID=A0A0E9W8L1_ANGAN